MNKDNYDMWYRSLPIHKMFLDGKESEIHYLAPDNIQPDFPFVYVDWNVDCESSDDDRDKLWHNDARVFFINKTFLMQSDFMYTII
jgi:hypothetical protein